MEHTKTYRDRHVIVIPKAVELINRIKHTGRYIFEINGERITSRQVAYVLEKYAERNKLLVKSTHKMRKTYASNLSANGVSVDVSSGRTEVKRRRLRPLRSTAVLRKKERAVKKQCLLLGLSPDRSNRRQLHA